MLGTLAKAVWGTLVFLLVAFLCWFMLMLATGLLGITFAGPSAVLPVVIALVVAWCYVRRERHANLRLKQ